MHSSHGVHQKQSITDLTAAKNYEFGVWDKDFRLQT